jgi:FMN phosphatase YigB (HAD superfamily)
MFHIFRVSLLGTPWLKITLEYRTAFLYAEVSITQKIIFFDGDGTLWYPSATRRTKKPWWVYDTHQENSTYLLHMEATPHAASVLEKLRSVGIVTVVLSTHPFEPAISAQVLKEKVSHFLHMDMFDHIYATAEYPEAKGEKMVEILQEKHLETEQTLMVGDSYLWDYLPARQNNIDAILLDSEYHQEHREKEPVTTVISELDELLPLLSIG